MSIFIWLISLASFLLGILFGLSIAEDATTESEQSTSTETGGTK
jgi:hypothetical protein